MAIGAYTMAILVVRRLEHVAAAPLAIVAARRGPLLGSLRSACERTTSHRQIAFSRSSATSRRTSSRLTGGSQGTIALERHAGGAVQRRVGEFQARVGGWLTSARRT